MIHCIAYMQINIHGVIYTADIERKRQKNMYMRLTGDHHLHISCPVYVTNTDVMRFIHDKENWIVKAEKSQHRQDNHIATGSDGTYVTWLGKTYKVQTLNDTVNKMVLHDDTVIYHVKDNLKETIDNIYYQTAGKKMAGMLEEKRKQWDEEICRKNHKSLPKITIKYMTSRWGSCTPARSHISMSVRLMHYPEECMDYVLLHEYVHILVPNHSKQFYDIVSYYMPEWKAYNQLLK